MAKAKKQPAPTTRARDPGVLSIGNSFVTDDLAKRMDEASRGDPAKLDEFNEAMYAEVMAHAVTMPEVRAARVIQRYEGQSLDINAEVDELRRLVGKVNKGDMTTPEAMLVAQAHTLDALFSNLAIRAHGNMTAGYLDASDRYFRLALKAQAQAAKTIQILADLKNPPVVFARNANVVNGPQQVNQNFDTSTRPHAHAGNFENSPSKLSGGSHELLENTRAPSLEGGVNPALEALGAVDRAAHCRR